jgi:DNA-binding NarL/FixJ family response regulator
MSPAASNGPLESPPRQRETGAPLSIVTVITLIAALRLAADETVRAAKVAGVHGQPEKLRSCCCGSEHLTEREISVLCLIAVGLSNAEIARSLHISGHTVDRHVTEMLRRTDVPNRAALVARAYSFGLLCTTDWPPRRSGRRCLR